MKESCIDEIKDSVIYNRYKGLKKYDEIHKCEISKDIIDITESNCRRINVKNGDIFNALIKDTQLTKPKSSKLLIIHKIIDLFIDSGLLNQKGDSYYLINGNKRLTWNNIKQLKMRDLQDRSRKSKLSEGVETKILEIFNGGELKYDIVILVKSLFWFFRKAIVDSLLSDIINFMGDKSTIAVSVGSTKLSSDYDISLDSSYELSGGIIKKFTERFEEIFNDDSENVFDTNVYGVSFTKNKGSDIFSENHKCEENDINYISGINTKIDVSQMIWAYIKLLLKMDVILKRDDKIYEKLYTELDNSMSENMLFQAAVVFTNKYTSYINKYKEAVLSMDSYMTVNELEDDDYLVSNFISFVNYNGSETYLTNGAFLDVVINQQMCQNKNIIEISSPFMYFTSFIENISDLMTHYHKTKYTDRGILSLKNLNILLSDFFAKEDECYKRWADIYGSTMKRLDSIKNLQMNCGNNIENCEIVKLIMECMGCIVGVSGVYYNCYVKIRYKDLVGDISRFNSIEFPQLKSRPVNVEDFYSSPIKGDIRIE
jgi:hypothetical protein